MNVSPVACAHLSSPSIARPPHSGSSRGSNSSVLRVRLTLRYSQAPSLFPVLVALVTFPASVSAAPPKLTPDVRIAVGGIHRRSQNSGSQSNSSGSSSDGSISMSVWLPILIVTLVFVLFSFVTCVRRCAAADAAAAAARTTATNQSGSTPAAGARPRRRPHRTPSQISTKSLPAYMKEPGDQELVLFRGPLETEDDSVLPHAVPTLAEDEEGHSDMRTATFDIALDRVESVDTMADASTTNLVRRVSASVPRPPELHHPVMPHEHRRSGDGRSLDSVGSEAELLRGHGRGLSVDNRAEPRGEAPSYMEAVSAQGGTSIISLNDPVPNSAIVPPSLAAGRGRPLSFLMHNPFSSHNSSSGTLSNVNQPPRSESPGLHMRSGSALSRFSTRESHDSHHSRTLSRNHKLSRSRSRSNSNLFRALRPHSPGLHAGSSTISLDSISAPLTHTLTRAEFHAPKGGLLTPEQIKLITSREALEKFGVPYGPDAVAAFSLSRERLAEMGPPPDFESATGASGSGVSTTAQRSTSSSGPSSHLVEERAGSPGTDVSYETALDSEWAQVLQTYASEGERETDGADEPRTARPVTPSTARALN